jgi:hypothetical protein
LAEYFCFKPIRAHWVGLTGTMLDGHRLGPNDVIYPMPGSLCMGFSWSLYFCQRINEYQCSLTRSLKDSTLVRDKGEPVVFRSEQVRRHGEPGSRHYVYVDNLGVLSSHAAYVKTALQELDEHFGSCGLLLHPGEVSVGEPERWAQFWTVKLCVQRSRLNAFIKLGKLSEGLFNVGGLQVRCLKLWLGMPLFVASTIA